MRNCTALRAIAAVCLVAASATRLPAADNNQPNAGRSSRFEYIVEPGITTSENFVCGTRPATEFLEAFNAAVARGEIPDPKLQELDKSLPPILGSLYRDTVSGLDIYRYPDINGILLTNFTDGQLFNLMTQAGNELIAQHGDQFDYIAFWLNSNADHQIGSAFYLGLENDITGLGEGIYNSRPSFGLAGVNTEGYVMMWNVYAWQPGTFQFSAFTRLVLGQEFEHRWGMFLNNINVDGTNVSLQGNDGACGRSAHWNFRVDGQGSGMEIAEWTGTGPVGRVGGTLNFNTDIGGVFSYTDLYLMGYVSPSEMDAGNSQLRYLMDDIECNSPYSGDVFDFGSANIVASNGARVPTSANSQRHYKTGWIMVYQPSNPTDTADLNRGLNIMKRHELDWNAGTLGRGTMDNRIDEGHFSTAGTLIGPGPQTIQFTYDTTFAASAWKWYFGDGDSSTLASPTHVYAPGAYTVQLKNTTPHDVRTTLKKDHIILWADTMWVNDVEIPHDTGAFYLEVYATNKVPIREFVLPVALTNVPGTLSLDSMSFIGCRTSYFEFKQLVFDNRGVGQVGYRMRADNGGGSAPLPAGTGPIARVWVHTNANTAPGESSDLTAQNMGSQVYQTYTLNSVSFVPPFDGATITVRSAPCDCACHADPQCDGAIDAVDVVLIIAETFRGEQGVTDPACTHVSRNDVDCDCSVNSVDVVRMIDVAFRGADPNTRFCNGCVDPCP